MSRNPQSTSVAASVFALLVGLLLMACSAAPAGGVWPRAHPANDLTEDGQESPYARLEDRTVIPGFEFGSCETDADCAPRGCGGAVCSPDIEPAYCLNGEIAMCFAELPASACGCDAGMCRWARVAPVMQCANESIIRPTNRPWRGQWPPRPYEPQ